jgi:hypothetical protein
MPKSPLVFDPAKAFSPPEEIERSNLKEDATVNSRTVSRIVILLAALGLQLATAASAQAQTTSFTFQGRLQDGGTSANGSYDFQFTLWDSLSGGAQQPQPSPVTVTKTNVPVTNGVFTVQLDFGASAFPGADRFLETGVRLNGGGTFTILAPRQPISSTPYAIRSASASSADVATTATNATQLGGVDANQYVVTSDSRLSDPRAPTAGSSNYIQNTASQQASSNFNISGDGMAGGTLSGNIINASTQLNLAGSRAFAVTGAAGFAITNTFGGLDSGTANSPANGGVLNTFFGAGAGRLNSSGAENSFFGSSSGRSNTTGTGNSYFGDLAGASNTTGLNGSFFGSGAGFSNTTGGQNSFFGQQSGNSNVGGGNNSFFGAHSGQANISGTSNSFFGVQTGFANTTGSFNSFFGERAGLNNTANNNSFFGSGTGYSNTTGTVNSFFGANAGGSNTTGEANSFFGTSAGAFNTTASNNSFFGYGAGTPNTTGGANSFFGVGAGGNNTTGSNNSFFGTDAGLNNTSGLYNTFIGFSAGNPSTSTQVNNSIAIGNGATVSTDNTIVLGTSAATTQIPGALRVSGSGSIAGNVGIGTTTPSTTLDVQNSSASATIRAKSTAGSGILYLDRASAIAANGSWVAFNTAGSPDFTMGTSQGSAGVSDFSIYNYGTASNVFTIQRSNGNVGIGTNPAVALEVRRNSTVASDWQTGQLRISGASDPNMQLSLGYDTSSNLGVIQAGQAFTGFKPLSLNPFGGNVGIGAVTPTAEDLTVGTARVILGLFLGVVPSGGTSPLCLNGTGKVTICNSSSLRYKTNVQNFSSGLGLVRRLQPITFDWKETGKPDFGLVAEDVEKIDPKLVFYKDGQVEGVRYDRIGVVLINAVKEQQAQIGQQQEQLKQQQEQIKRQQDQAKQQAAELRAQQQQFDALKKLLCRSHPHASVCR